MVDGEAVAGVGGAPVPGHPAARLVLAVLHRDLAAEVRPGLHPHLRHGLAALHGLRTTQHQLWRGSALIRNINIVMSLRV